MEKSNQKQKFEKAILLSRFSYIINNNLAIEKYDRLYFGIEFCERLIPTLNQVKEAIKIATDKNLQFSLLTPYVTDEGLQKIKKLADFLGENYPDSEIVFNDWGFFWWLVKNKNPCTRVMGRLLNRQKRGPRLMKIKHLVPESMIDHFQRSYIDTKWLVQYLMKLGVKRIELDNLLQGIKRDSPLYASLYYPWAYVSTTRLCLTNSIGNRIESLRTIFPCKKDCYEWSFTMKHPDMPVDLILKGNSYFFKNERLPENLKELKIDRLVYEPFLPI